MVPKILFLKNSIFQLSNDVSTASVAPLQHNLHPEEILHFYLEFGVFLRNLTFLLKITGNSQTLQLCTETFRSRRKTCDTAFESSDIILFNPRNFGYHWGTQNPSKSSTFILKIETKISN